MGNLNSRPLVSIVTPTLNRASLLEYTLRSVRSQSYRNIEHLVMDGGSSDSTLDLLRRYETTYPLRWRSEPDNGMYQAINRGLQETQGEIVAYLNSDDLYLPWALEVVVRCFGEHPDADFVYGGMISIDEKTKAEHLHFQPPFNLDFIRRVGFLGQPAVFWRRRVLESEGLFDTSLRYVADCDYWMRAGARQRFRRLTEFVAVERDHESTLREAHGEQLWPELAAVRARYVRMHGPRHVAAVRWHGLRRYFWLLVDWSRFAALSLMPRPIRRGPWTRLLNAGVRVEWLHLPLRLIPGASRTGRPTIRSDHDWLTPPPDGATGWME